MEIALIIIGLVLILSYVLCGIFNIRADYRALNVCRYICVISAYAIIMFLVAYAIINKG
jgi:hypothetical protein